MDMSRHLPLWINSRLLSSMENRFEGTIIEVVEQTIRNPFTRQRQTEPVLKFEGGYRLVPNIGMRVALCEMFGAETDHWIGERVIVVQVPVTSANGTVRYEKKIVARDRAAYPRLAAQ
jgi:hypothetical protein